MDEDRRLEEIKRIRNAMEIIENVVNNGDALLALEIENQMDSMQEELKKMTWGNCGSKNCTIQEWIRLGQIP